MPFNFGINKPNNAQPTSAPIVQPKPTTGFGFGVNKTTPGQPQIKKMPDFLGGGAYTSVAGQPNTLVKENRGYAGVKEVPGNQRDHVFPVSLGGVSSDKANIKITPENQAGNVDEIEKQAARDFKAGKISLPQAQLMVLTAKQKAEDSKGFFTPVQDKVRARDIVSNLPSAAKTVAKQVIGGAVNLFTSGEQKLGETFGGLPAMASKDVKAALESQQKLEDAKNNLALQISKNKKAGKDTSRLESTYKQITGQDFSKGIAPAIGETLGTLVPASNKTIGQILAEGGEVALDIITAGSLPGLIKTAKGLYKAKDLTKFQKIIGEVKTAFKGGGLPGAGYGALNVVQEGGTPGEIAKGAATGAAIGTGFGFGVQKLGQAIAKVAPRSEIVQGIKSLLPSKAEAQAPALPTKAPEVATLPTKAPEIPPAVKPAPVTPKTAKEVVAGLPDHQIPPTLKKQLTTEQAVIVNPIVKQNEDKLVQQAKNYKTEKEFIDSLSSKNKSLINPEDGGIYLHGTSQENYNSLLKNGFNPKLNKKGFAEQPEAFHVADATEAGMYGPNTVAVKAKDGVPVKTINRSDFTPEQNASFKKGIDEINWAKKNGYDAINAGDELIIVNPNKFEVFDKKKLTDTWNKAQKPAPEVKPASKPIPKDKTISPIIQRINKNLDDAKKINPELDITNHKEQLKLAEKEILANPKEAYNKALYGGKEQNGALRTTLLSSFLENAKNKVDDQAIADIGTALGKHGRKSGQEIEMIKAMMDNNPTNKLLYDLSKKKMDNVEVKYPKIKEALKNVGKETDDISTKIKDVIKKKRMSIVDAQALLNKITCK